MRLATSEQSRERSKKLSPEKNPASKNRRADEWWRLAESGRRFDSG
jgi:hypothetical protein